MNGSKIVLNLMKTSLKNYNEESDKGHFLQVDVQFLEKLNEVHIDLPFLPTRKKIEKFE